MKLYYSPFACSLAAHITCREAGLDVDLTRAELSTKRVEGGADLFALNPMGQVPTLVTDDGHTIVENGAVLTYLADRVPERGLAPAPDSFERYELTRWLSFVGTEIHKKGLALIFAPDSPEAVKEFARASLVRPLGVLDRHLQDRASLMNEFSVADAYLFWALTIAPHGGVSLEAFPALGAYQERLLERPAVRAAVRFERDQRERPFAA
ncbi:MAG: glutathione transferase GstA [Polyangiaceae bacterium]